MIFAILFLFTVCVILVKTMPDIDQQLYEASDDETRQDMDYAWEVKLYTRFFTFAVVLIIVLALLAELCCGNR